jgi:hypothetical protein
LFLVEVANSILVILLFNVVGEDKLVWTNDVHGNYSLIYVGLQEDWLSLWKMYAPPKVKHLLGAYVESVCRL